MSDPAVALLAEKTPAESKAYAIDWSLELGADTISAVAWSRTFSGGSAVTLTSPSNTSTVATVLVGGGEVGGFYPIRCQVTTAAGQVLNKDYCIPVVAAK